MFEKRSNTRRLALPPASDPRGAAQRPGAWQRWVCLGAAGAAVVGSAGPWVDVGTISFSGLSGLGLLVFLIALLTFALALLLVVFPRRLTFVSLAVAGAAELIAAFLAWGAIRLFAGSAHALSWILTRTGADTRVLRHAGQVATGWGLPVLGLGALVLLVVSCVGATASSHGPFAGSAVRPAPELSSGTKMVYAPIRDRTTTRWR
jgi:hypothetical protein